MALKLDNTGPLLQVYPWGVLATCQSIVIHGVTILIYHTTCKPNRYRPTYLVSRFSSLYPPVKWSYTTWLKQWFTSKICCVTKGPNTHSRLVVVNINRKPKYYLVCSKLSESGEANEGRKNRPPSIKAKSEWERVRKLGKERRQTEFSLLTLELLSFLVRFELIAFWVSKFRELKQTRQRRKENVSLIMTSQSFKLLRDHSDSFYLS